VINTALNEVKATKIDLMEVSAITPIFDYVIIATVESGRQSRAAVQKIRELLKELEVSIIGVEGLDNGEWVLVDTGSVVLHMMLPKTRTFYALEELWGS
tara:strand:- start:526 stop:822 length:297 start_codon:yes stop_codon:yes gene_type:complete